MDSDVIFIGLSGKRGAGKDTFAKILKSSSDKVFEIKSLAESFKRLFAQHAGLDFERLMNDRDFKEQHRVQMNKFFEEANKADPGKWAKYLVSNIQKGVNVVIVADVRLKTDVAALKKHCSKVFFVRIETENAVKEKFGWKFNEVVDAHFTETNLDDFESWDFVLKNDGTKECFENASKELISRFKL